jgi:hypothetical protein
LGEVPKLKQAAVSEEHAPGASKEIKVLLV